MDTTLSNGAQGTLTIIFQGQPSTSGDGALSIIATQVTLGQTSDTPLYQGNLTNLRGNRRLRMEAFLTRVSSQNGTGGHGFNFRYK
jgi:hypothetical protein